MRATLARGAVTITAEDEAAFSAALAAEIPWAPQVIGVSPLYLSFTSAPADGLARRRSADTAAGPEPVAGLRRREIIRSRFRTMRGALLHLANGGAGRYQGVYVSYDGALVTRAASEAEAGEAFAPYYTTTTTATTVTASPTIVTARSGQGIEEEEGTRGGAAPPYEAFLTSEDYCHPVEDATGEGGRGGGMTMATRMARDEEAVAFERTRQRRAALWASLALRRGPEVGSLLEVYMPDWGSTFTPPPPPPALSQAVRDVVADGADTATAATAMATEAAAAPSSLAQSPPARGASVFTPQMLVPLVPTYFIPLREFLRQMPAGYTLAHVEHIFREMGILDLVRLPGTTPVNTNDPEEVVTEYFIRLHGGRTRVAFGVTAGEGENRHRDRHRHYNYHRRHRNRGPAAAAHTRWWGTGAGHGDDEDVCARAEVGDRDDGEALVVHRRFAEKYEPDPFLCDAFLPVLRARDATPARPAVAATAVPRWYSLRSVVEPAPPHIQRALGPFQARRSLLFFSQMQHRFAFDAGGAGSLAAAAGPRGWAALREETTPIPLAVAEVVALLRERGRVYVSDLESAQVLGESESATTIISGGDGGGGTTPQLLTLSDYTKRSILRYFGTLRDFLFAHPDIFACVDAGGADPVRAPAATAPCARTHRGSGFAAGNGLGTRTAADAGAGEDHLRHSPTLTVGLTASRAAHGTGHHVSQTPMLSVAGMAEVTTPAPLASSSYSTTTTLTLEEKLEKALLRKDRRAAQKVRRRLAMAQAPDAPFGDPEVLLAAMLRYLPTRRHVSVRYFLSSLPAGLTDFLPEVPLQLIRSAVPDRVQLFEWRRRNHLCLMRPGLPLPDGRLRDRYTEEELLFMVAEELQQRAVRGRGTASEPMSSLFSRLPYGARMGMGGSVKNFFEFLQRHPDMFLVVFQDAVRMDVRQARVSLLAMPETLAARVTMAPHDWDAEGLPPSPAELAAWHAEDEAAMREQLAEAP